jgi:ABC-type multidrug transport system fused ATPase/permease subunit
LFSTKKLSRYIIRNWRVLILGIACMIVTTYINVYIPQLSGQVIKDILKIRDYELLISIGVQIIVLTGLLGVLSFVQRYANGYFSQRVAFDIRNDVFKSIQGQSLAFFDKVETGQLMSRTTTDVDKIKAFLGGQLMMFTSSILLIIGVVTSMTRIDSELTLLSFSVIPFLFVNFFFFGTKIRTVTYSARRYFGVLTSILWENITGIRVVRSFAREEYEKKKFQIQNENYLGTMMQAVRLRSIFTPLSTLLGGVVMVVLFWYGGMKVINNQLGIDQLFVFGSYALMLVKPVNVIGTFWGSYQVMAAAGQRVFEIIDALPQVEEKLNAITLPPVKGHVVFEKVFFGYNKDRVILENINLEAKCGETTALLGPTGSGKSTIIRLLPRFYDVTYGRILVDGYDIRDVKIESLRKQIGIVSQETFLFNLTVKENIAYGKPNATMDEIIEVAKIARAHDFIMNLPKGYDTLIAERGVTLSGGQQQRIAIARALLMDPRILILDDSTSSIDVDTEYEIQQALAALLKNRTTFVVTQRVSTIRNADRIVVLQNGRVIEEGNHESLMVKNGAYHTIFHSLYDLQKEIIQPHQRFIEAENKQTQGGTE